MTSYNYLKQTRIDLIKQIEQYQKQYITSAHEVEDRIALRARIAQLRMELITIQRQIISELSY